MDLVEVFTLLAVHPASFDLQKPRKIKITLIAKHTYNVKYNVKVKKTIGTDNT